MITLRTLGPVEVTVDGEPAPRELLWRKNLALLLYLARSPERRRSREHLVGVFWGDKPDASARHSLNEALHVIRKSAGEDVVESVGDQVVLSGEAIEIDADQLDARLDAEKWSEAVDLIRGSFLEGFTVPDSSAFEDWLGAERVFWIDRMVEGIRRHAETLLSRGDGQAAQDAAVKALALDPFSDSAVRLAMLAAAVRGERAGALTLYDTYATRLTEELGLEPDPETDALAERIRSEREWRLPDTVTDVDRWARRIPLVGRERELEAALGAVFGAFRDRVGALVFIQGESGSGKTRLGDEIASRARLEGAVVSHIRVVPSDRQSPWSGLTGLCRSALLDASAAIKAPPEALAFALASAEEPDEQLARVAIGADPAMPPRALADLTRAAASLQPVLLWIDGAEYLDPESAACLQAVLRDTAETPSVLLLTACSYPPREELDELRARIGRDLSGASFSLGALDRAGLCELAGHVLPDLDDEATDRLARRIEADSAGVPLLALELLNAVRLGLELDDVMGTWPQPFRTMEQTYPGDLPDSVVAALRIGYRRLGRPAQKLLAAASVLGERCDAAMLSAATGIAGDELFGALDELEWNRWLVAETRGYVFVARIVRDIIARDMLTAGQRQRLLKAIAGD
jgi:DNA-binding SARP family transcriptional activator